MSTGEARFTGRAAIVTGAAQGIGLAVAHRLAAEGADLVLADLDEQGLKAAAAGLADRTGRTPAVAAGDLSTPGGADHVVRTALSAYDRIDILVNNAGGGVILPTLDHTEETLRATIDRNLWTALYCSLAVLPVMVKASYGRIVSLGAESVRNGLVNHAVYNAAKGGVHALASGLAREFAPNGITVNAVAPSIVTTDQVTAGLADPKRRPLVERMIATVPMGRPATLEEVASAVAYLASEEAGFITGQIVSVNGGSSMQ
jgi:2,3-dihydroxy-2,3-dihydro-p-cumate dehydrogenase